MQCLSKRRQPTAPQFQVTLRVRSQSRARERKSFKVYTHEFVKHVCGYVRKLLLRPWVLKLECGTQKSAGPAQFLTESCVSTACIVHAAGADKQRIDFRGRRKRSARTGCRFCLLVERLVMHTCSDCLTVCSTCVQQGSVASNGERLSRTHAANSMFILQYGRRWLPDSVPLK